MLRSVTLLIALLTAAALTLTDRRPPADDTVVPTAAGAVRGVAHDSHRVFAAVPYAAAPVDELRWRPPQPVPAWSGVRPADRPGSACTQHGRELGRPSTAEDCLHLTVTTPRHRTGPARPVLVWLHGGSFADGAGDQYGGARLAVDGDLVVVTVNYRLGPLGFLAHPALGEAGNLGLADQQAALRWVGENIAAFGGDPRRVTLAGESAGATSVCAQLAAPGSRGLFHRAVLQSGPCRAGSILTPEQARERADRLVTALGCGEADPVRCLRAASPAALLDAADGLGLGPHAGDAVLPIDPVELLERGELGTVPVLAGINRDEERLMVWGEELATGPLDAAGFDAALRAEFGADADAVAARYPAGEHPALALAAARTDDRWARPLVRLLDRWTAPAFGYLFADRSAPFLAGFPPPSFPTGAFHTAELAYLFDVDFAERLSPRQQTVSAAMVEAWARFAHTGDPGWPAGAPARRFAPSGPTTVDLPTHHHTPFWAVR